MRFSFRLAGWFVAGLCALAFFPATGASGERAIAIRDASTGLTATGIRLLKPGLGEFDECWECLSCEFFTHHKNPLVGRADDGFLAPHQECIAPEYCEGGHPTCSGFALDMDETTERVLGGSGEVIARLLREHANEMLLNVDRQAVQILGCRGELRAHIPLQSAQMEYLDKLLGVAGDK